MRVCLEYQSALGPLSGVGRYTHQLANALFRDIKNDSLYLYCSDPLKRHGNKLPLTIPLSSSQLLPYSFAQKWWNLFNWPGAERIMGDADIYHFPNFTVPPLKKGKSIVTIHDVVFEKFPELVEEKNLAYLTRNMAKTLRRADAIITVSKKTSLDLNELFGINEDKIVTIYPGITRKEHQLEKGNDSRLIEQLGVNRPFLLFVSTIEPRKNISFLIKVFEELRHFDGELLIVGSFGWKYESVLQSYENSTRRHSIRFLRYIHDDTLQSLYRKAELFVFPSLYEGFGFPPLEAMLHGTPVISSTGGALKEVLQGGAVLLDEYDVELWRSTVQSLIEDTEKREYWSKKGMDHAKKFTWEHTAKMQWDVYRGL